MGLSELGNALAVHLKSAICAIAFAVIGVARTAGAEICVKCSGPDATYACVVNTSAAGTIDTVIKLYCITSLAKVGPHESCAIDRSSSPPCQGERRELPLPSQIEHAVEELEPDQSAPSPNVTADPNVAPASKPADAAAGAAKEVPPKTVQEIVEKGAKSAGDGISDTQKNASTALEKAGSAVGIAAKSSWKCLSSFFTKC